MPLRNTEAEYGAVTKALHWTVALLVITLLAVGLTMGGIKDLGLKLATYNLHKSLGITVLALVLCRIGWHVFSRRPAPLETLAAWEKLGSVAVHYTFYLLLVAMPLTGWLMSSAAGRPVQFFGLFTLPDLVAADPAAAQTYRARHDFIGWCILGLAALHIGAALNHHFIKKDDVLKRMLPALLFIALFAATPARAEAQKEMNSATRKEVNAGARQWTMQHDKSTITFRPKQMGTEFSGTFGVFSADIRFDPEHLAASKAVINVQLGTARTGAADRDEALKGKEWFDVARFPDAKFATTSFRNTGPDAYVAEGILEIRGIPQPVTLPFTLKIEKGEQADTATMDGTVTLGRAQFGLGLGQWADPGIIANEVPVDIHVVALSRHE